MNAMPAPVVPMVPPSAAAGHDPDREKRLEAARRRRKANRYKPFLFVVAALGAWWLLTVLSDLVITCAPGGASCRAPYLVAKARGLLTGTLPVPTAPPPPLQLTTFEWAMLLLSLLAALWVAKAAVYPSSDSEFTEEELDGNASP